uniref:Uncharacterized protein n=1 Tax=Aegilops tauschii subsp. strangulata TaxID=200361 RepID=A0A453D7V7_AEGTS
MRKSLSRPQYCTAKKIQVLNNELPSRAKNRGAPRWPAVAAASRRAADVRPCRGSDFTLLLQEQRQPTTSPNEVHARSTGPLAYASVPLVAAPPTPAWKSLPGAAALEQTVLGAGRESGR